MIEERLQDISLYYFIKELLGNQVNVVDGFPKEELKLENLPTVAVENRRARFDFFELGSKDSIVTRGFIIYIYAATKTQRDDLAYRIAKALRNPVGVYNYDEGFPPDVTPTKIGALTPKNIELVIAQIDPTLVKTFFYRAEVHYNAQYLSRNN